MSEHKYTNALAQETSPYLLQHAHNPVQWYPWSEQALRRAKEEDKPILLSIGYSACHWCHVMERESFENEEIAQLMNEHFINIKVDREERPDLDAIYMAAVQMMTGNGGWPMTVFLTPDQIPFYGGTYYPPEDRRGMPGFPRILLSVSRAYRQQREAIEADAGAIVGALAKATSLDDQKSELQSDLLDGAVANLLGSYDSQNGGFGLEPKFPAPMALSFLLRSHVRSRDRHLLEIVEQTLEKMACGGIYDHLGGGFHRYSVDRYWLVPHFEKMLYDDALLSRLYLDAYLLTRKERYRRIAEETLDYVLREMTSPEGGFYSTQDADSEGHEGRFFVWSPREVEEVLGEKDGELFCRYYDVTREGNFEGKNILNVPRPASMVAALSQVPEERLQEAIERGQRLLFEAREKRVKPSRDEKILAAWNALMTRSFAEAASALGRDDYRQAAARNGEFLLSNLQSGGRLLRTYKDGGAKLNGYLEDYAFLVDALLSLYEATFDPRWISEARRLAGILIEQFWDPEGGGFYFTSTGHERLIHRPRDFYDNATPSGNSAAALALQRLSMLTGDEGWMKYARSVLEQMAAAMSRHPAAFAHLLCALDFYLSKPKQIAIAGDPGARQTRRMLEQVFQRYLPNKVIVCGMGEDLAPLKGRPQVSGMPTAYVCERGVCKAPVTSPAELAALLAN